MMYSLHAALHAVMQSAGQLDRPRADIMINMR